VLEKRVPSGNVTGLELEGVDGIDGGPPALGVALYDPRDEGEVQLGVQKIEQRSSSSPPDVAPECA
jgi:hypothetical protein